MLVHSCLSPCDLLVPWQDIAAFRRERIALPWQECHQEQGQGEDNREKMGRPWHRQFRDMAPWQQFRLRKT